MLKKSWFPKLLLWFVMYIWLELGPKQRSVLSHLSVLIPLHSTCNIAGTDSENFLTIIVRYRWSGFRYVTVQV